MFEWLTALFSGERSEESRQYRREMYRGQQEAWKEQEKNDSFQVPEKPLIRLSSIYMDRANLADAADWTWYAAAHQQKWECEGMGSRGGGGTPIDAFDSWMSMLEIDRNIKKMEEKRRDSVTARYKSQKKLGVVK